MITPKSAADFALSLLITTLILISALLSPLSTSEVAEAETYGFGRADSREVYFCERRDLSFALFAIPYTYCVEILAQDGEWYRVKYADDNPPYCAIYGYCRAEDLTPLTLPPENIYLNMPVTVTYKTETPPTSLPVLGELNVTAAFYGNKMLYGEEYSYVCYDGSFGYIYGVGDNYPLNEIPEIVEEPEPEKEEINSTLIISLILAGLAAGALFILYFTKGRNGQVN